MHDERRKHQRRPWPQSISLQVSEDGQTGPALHAETVDLSAGGICITNKEPLPPGTVLNFGTARMVGIVRWTTQFDKEYKSGIKLI